MDPVPNPVVGSAFVDSVAIAEPARRCCSYSVVRGRYPVNLGDHLMLGVIGSRFTLEYALKGMYENTLGRFPEWTARHELTDEDRYAAGVAGDYGQFVADRPFYEFPFFHAFGGL
jgi:hypothetical protein